MAFIPKEIPSWVIDGINKIFTLLNDVDYITSVYLDGAIYVDFTLSGKVITLSDAPTSTIYVDYYTADSIIPIVTNTKLSDVKTKIWRLLWVQPNSGNFSSEILTEEINDVMSDIWRGNIVNRLTNKIISSGWMYFQENYYSFRISKKSNITSDVSIGDTSINMPTDGMNAQGWVMIWGDYIQYTSKTDTSIEWVSGITTSHNSGATVIQLYTLPLNYDIMIQMDEVNYQYSWVRYTPINWEWVVKFDILRVWSVPLLKIDWLAYDTIIRTKYSTKYVDVTDNDSDFPLPDRYGTICIAYIVAGQMWYDKMMLQAERNLKTGYDNLLQMWNFYTRKIQSKTKIRPKAYAKIWRISQ